jgi:hypothetical protein
MVDTENRLKAASLIQDFRDGNITNEEFVSAFPRSEDKAIQAIGSMLWFCYDDLHEHRLTGKHALTVEGEKLVDRCILFLNTNLEYFGETGFTSILAPVKKFWRWSKRHREPAIGTWWPFNDHAQLKEYEKARKVSAGLNND